MNIWILLFTLLISAPLKAASELWSVKNFDTVNFSAGTWMEFYDEMQVNSSGQLNDDFQLTPYLSIATEYKLPHSQFIIPEVSYILQEKTTDGSTNINRFLFRADYAYMPKNWLRLRLGSSLIIQSISGSGGEKELANGSSTQTYYKPEERKNTYNQTLDYALEVLIDRLALKAQGHIYAFNEDEQRMTSYSLSLSYRIPIKELL